MENQNVKKCSYCKNDKSIAEYMSVAGRELKMCKRCRDIKNNNKCEHNKRKDNCNDCVSIKEKYHINICREKVYIKWTDPNTHKQMKKGYRITKSGLAKAIEKAEDEKRKLVELDQ